MTDSWLNLSGKSDASYLSSKCWETTQSAAVCSDLTTTFFTLNSCTSEPSNSSRYNQEPLETHSVFTLLLNEGWSCNIWACECGHRAQLAPQRMSRRSLRLAAASYGNELLSGGGLYYAYKSKLLCSSTCTHSPPKATRWKGSLSLSLSLSLLPPPVQ